MGSLHDASFFCIPDTDLPEKGPINYRRVYCVISLCSGFLGMFGSCYQLFAGKQRMAEWPRRRSRRPSTNPEIIFFLAASNLMSCLGKNCKPQKLLPQSLETIVVKVMTKHNEKHFVAVSMVEGPYTFIKNVCF